MFNSSGPSPGARPKNFVRPGPRAGQGPGPGTGTGLGRLNVQPDNL